jgi:GT2 family glycosyltransferase
VTAPSVSAIICCYTERRWDDVVVAVKSLSEQTVAPAEVLLVVDHNEALRSRAAAEFDGVRVVANTRRAGLSGARNTGVACAAGEIVAFLDDDARADPRWLARMLAPYAEPDVVAVGGRALPVWPGDGPPAHLPAELYWVVGCGYTGQPTALAEVRNLMGCAMSLRRAPVMAAGGFTEHLGRTASLPLGCEETELCIRLRQRMPGARILLEPAALVYHRVTAERLSWRYLWRRSRAEGVSKAAIARLVGRGDALATEQSYVRSVLPRALGRAARTGSPAAAGGILAAVAGAGLGYLSGRRRAPEPVTGTVVSTVDLAGAVPASVEADTLALVRRGPVTVGTVRFGAGEAVRGSEAIAALGAIADEQAAQLPPVPGVLPSVSVVLATAGRAQLAARCVRAVLATGYPGLEVVVVDNRAGAPDPALVELAGTDERIRYLRQPTPGASLARNTGARAATGELLAFTDDDAVVDGHWLTAAVAELAATGAECVTGLVMPLALETRAQVWFEEFGGFGKGYRRRVFGPDTPPPTPLYPLSPGIYGSGNNMVWRRAAFEGVGGFDERLGPGRRTRAGEDLDLFVRLVTGGGTIAYTPHALVWHEHRGSLAELRGQLRGYGTGLAATVLLHALRPGGAIQIARRLPAGLRRLLDPRSDRNAERGADFPRALVVSELAGMLRAPGTLLLESLKR